MKKQDRLPGLSALKLCGLLALVCLVGAGPGWCQTPGSPPESSQPFINSIRIFGNATVRSKVLFNEMVTSRPLPFRWRTPPKLNPDDFNDDLERLKALYRRHGFYHTKIDADVQESQGQVDIRIHIHEGPWIRISSVAVSVVGPERPGPLKTQVKENPLVRGERFTEKKFEGFKKEILNYLLDHGYPKARVEGEVLLDAAANTAQVFVQVWPGPRCTFGEITVRGWQDTPEALIRRNLRVKKGELFSLEKIIASQERLYELDLFRSILVDPEEVPEEETKIPLTVEVGEKKKRSLRIGAGYGSWDEFRARAILRYRNFAGGGRILEMSTKYSRLDNRFEGMFLNPMIFGYDLDLVITTGLLRRYYPSFSDKAFYSRALLEREFPGQIKGYVGHGLEFARPFNVSDAALQLLRETRPGKLYEANMVLWGLSRNTIDNPAEPQKGGQVFFLGEWAPALISPKLQFVQSNLEVRQYHNLGPKNVVLAGRIKFGVMPPIQDTDQIPIYRRYFTGGPTSMRAYRNYYLGPRDEAGNPLGGESIFISNLEVRFPLYEDFRGVAFFDAGNVFYKVKDTDLGQIKYGAGFGLRYQTPIGPIGVEFAWPLNPINRERDKYQIVFNIGQTF
ncbi:MAG: hypothetical protein FJ135_12025 [Deltaproteobacteria bacterium]|nr:hypothetical protein [Deltaproteobacteria bacterium]